MAPTRDEFEEAVASFWDVRQSQALSSRLAGVVGAGNAGSVRGAGHFHAVAAVVARFFMDAGYPAESVRVTGRQGLALPGYFRPQKLWDVVVAHRGTLVAALELKALCGPSFGNNYNNRVEEALGSAIDVHHAQLAKLYPGEKPWLGYFFCSRTRIGRGSRSPSRRECSTSTRHGAGARTSNELSSSVRGCWTSGFTMPFATSPPRLPNLVRGSPPTR